MTSAVGVRLSTLVQGFDSVASMRPDAVALEHGDRRLSYAGLAAASARIAAVLRSEASVRPGDRVALAVPPSPEVVAALLAVLRCGAAYVPLDAQNPPARNRLILDDSRPRAVVGDPGAAEGDRPVIGAERLRDLLAESGEPAEVRRPPAGEVADPDRVAYVIYTSGTTGRPKGVPITHGNVLALFDAAAGLFAFGPDDTWLLFHSLAFDFSVWELWGALLHGGRLVLTDQWTKISPPDCAELVVRSGVTVLNQTPTAFTALARALLDRGTAPAELPLRYVVFGGERLAPGALRPWAERFGLAAPRLVNMYGLTEATVHATHHEVTPADLGGDASVIGRMLPGFVARVVGADGPDCARGELVVAGPQVARGYLDRPELTAERFGPDPAGALAGATFYRTGDLVERRGDDLVYLGRADRQAKVRGHRIELGEVEAGLRAVPDVADAVVVVVPARDGQPALGCAYTTHSGQDIEPRAFRRMLRDRLPQYMWPARFRRLAQLPLTPNGKADADAVRREWSEVDDGE